MSFEITTPFVEQYKNEVKLLLQQAGVLRHAVTEESITGKKAFFEQIGTIEAVERISRHSDTPLTPHPHARRSLVTATYEMADLIDDADKVRLLIDPGSSYMQSMKLAAGRQIDRIIRDAMTGTAATGVSGAGTADLDDTNKVARTFNEDGSATSRGLTVGKLREAAKIFGEKNVDPSEERYIAVRPQQVNDLLRDDEVTSADFNTVKALVTGEIDTYMGFKFIQTNLLTNDSSDYTTCFAWVRSAMILGVGQDVQAQVAVRADKSFSTQYYVSMDFGATRMEEGKVVEITCDESP